MKELCGSVLAANHANLARDVKKAENEGISRFHIDVTDGHYTPEITFGVQLVRDLRRETDAVLDVHLAVFNLPVILDSFLDSGADSITLQYEACDLPQRLLTTLKKRGVNACLSFIPATGFERIEYFIDEADTVNLLGVDPGIGGQQFISKILNKVEKTAAWRDNHGLKTRIAVDGGLNRDNCRRAAEAGADILIFGSGIFRGNISENINALRMNLEGC
ncbi:MAG: ribulose-phosphate 3-epimerase [Treponema sp.]|jgi:ribulose-phosphate 3-epimerase|nr:ribulose-phosphate 3-epimerase [Treponema sp.]